MGRIIDNVALEHRLALDLRERGLIEKIYPIMIGDKTDDELSYKNYFASGCHPNLSALTTTVVASIESKVKEHLDKQSLGTPMLPEMPVTTILDRITCNQGVIIEGFIENAFDGMIDIIVKMVEEYRETLSQDQISNSRSIKAKSKKVILPAGSDDHSSEASVEQEEEIDSDVGDIANGSDDTYFDMYSTYEKDADIEMGNMNPLHNKGKSNKAKDCIDDMDVEIGQVNPLHLRGFEVKEVSRSSTAAMGISSQRIRDFGALSGKGASLLARKKPEARNKTKLKPPTLMNFAQLDDHV